MCKSRNHHLSAYKPLPGEDMWESNICCRPLKCVCVCVYVGTLFLVYCKHGLRFFSSAVLTVNSSSLYNANAFYKCGSNCESREKQIGTVPCHLRLQTAFEMWWHTLRNQISSFGKRASPFKLAGASVQSNTGSRGVRISGSNAGYTMFRGSVRSIGYTLHSPVSPSLPLLCVTVCHHISTGLYHNAWLGVLGFTFCLPLALPFYLDVAYPNSVIHFPTERGFLFALTQTLRRIWLTQSVSIYTNHAVSLTQGDRKVDQPKVLYLVLARNECDEYVCVSVQKPCTGKERVTWRDTISAFALKPCLQQHVFFQKCSLLLVLNTIFKLDTIWFFF